MFNNGIRE